MRAISEKKLRDFWAVHPDAETPLRAWLLVLKTAKWKTFADVRESFPHASHVGHLVVFNIGGNKYRLIVALHLNRDRAYIRHVLTHKEYDQEHWKEESSPPRRPKGPKKPKDKPG